MAIRNRLLSLVDEELRVLDCCAGKGVIWDRLGTRWDVRVYVPIDIKPRRTGTIRADSRLVLQSWDISRFNVIDIDTYGEPWAHWFALAPRIVGPTAVFLTHGHMAGGRMVTTSSLARRAMGIPPHWRLPPNGMISRIAASFCLPKACASLMLDPVVVWHGQRVSYYGLLARRCPDAKRDQRDERVGGSEHKLL